MYILAVYVNDQRRLVAMPLPDLDDGDPFAHCPGWHRFWHNKLHRPFWHLQALGGTWRRPDGWRGMDYLFPVIVLARNLHHWRRLDACEGICRATRRDLRKRAFSGWVSGLAHSDSTDAYFAYADAWDEW